MFLELTIQIMVFQPWCMHGKPKINILLGLIESVAFIGNLT